MRKTLVAACLAFGLAACGGSDNDNGGSSGNTNSKCMTPSGTYTVTFSYSGGTCSGTPLDIPSYDETVASEECKSETSTNEEIADNGCKVITVAEGTGTEDGYSGTAKLTFDCTSKGGGTCEMRYNVHFDKR